MPQIADLILGQIIANAVVIFVAYTKIIERIAVLETRMNLADKRRAICVDNSEY